MAVRLRAIAAVWACQPCAVAGPSPAYSTRADSAREWAGAGRQSTSCSPPCARRIVRCTLHISVREAPLCPPSNGGARATARIARADLRANERRTTRHDTCPPARAALRRAMPSATYNAQTNTGRYPETPRSVIADAKARGVEPPKADASDELALFKSARAHERTRTAPAKGGLGQRQGRGVSRRYRFSTGIRGFDVVRCLSCAFALVSRRTWSC